MLLTNEEVQAMKSTRQSTSKGYAEAVIMKLEAELAEANKDPKIMGAGVTVDELKAEFPAMQTNEFVQWAIVKKVRDHFGKEKVLLKYSKFPTRNDTEKNEVVQLAVKK